MNQLHITVIFSTTFIFLLTGCSQDQPLDNPSPSGEPSQTTSNEPEKAGPSTDTQKAITNAESTIDTTPEHPLDKRIAEAVGMLEKKEYESFTRSFLEPAQAQNEKTVQQRTASLGQNGVGDLILEALKSIQGKQPSFRSDETEAIFQLDKEVGSARHLKFEKIDDQWYYAG